MTFFGARFQAKGNDFVGKYKSLLPVNSCRVQLQNMKSLDTIKFNQIWSLPLNRLMVNRTLSTTICASPITVAPTRRVSQATSPCP